MQIFMAIYVLQLLTAEKGAKPCIFPNSQKAHAACVPTQTDMGYPTPPYDRH